MRQSAVRLEWPARDVTEPAPRVNLVERTAGDGRQCLVLGENLAALAALARAKTECFALAYLDPPFLTQRRHARVLRARDPRTGVPSRREVSGFDDRWSGGLEEWLVSLRERARLVRELLTRDGSLVLHVDTRTSHYAKVLLDELFGPECFASEIVWRYRRWPSRTPNFQRVHDVLLRWVKDPGVRPRFAQLYEPLAASTQATWGDRRQRAVVQDGRRARSTRTEEPSRGAPLGDVWDIGIIAPVARERTGWPTQKPEALLERLLSACTLPGDAVLDPYLGSGTTLVVAERLGRRGVGIDREPGALECARARLQALGCRPSELTLVPSEPPLRKRPGRLSLAS